MNLIKYVVFSSSVNKERIMFCSHRDTHGSRVYFTNSNDCFAAMASGKVDAVCTNAAVVSTMVNTSYTDAAVVGTYATGEEYGAAVSKSNPELLAAINKALAELEADGTLDALSSKWL